jgi:hypothetical protein
MARSKGKGRAHICHPELHTAGIMKGGPRLPHLNPHFQVVHQNEPTPAHPVSQHKQFKGHSTAHTAHRPIK